MAETTARIRWEDTPVGTISGHVGSIEQEAFAIWKPPQASGEWVLESGLPGLNTARCYGDDPEALKDEAERWLAGFVSSVGAVFPAEPDDDLFGDDEDGEPLEVKYASGRRVRYIHPDAGYPGEKEDAAASLTLGEVYTIGWADIGQSKTDLNLYRDGAPMGRFNSVFFELADDGTTAATTAREKE